jgi:hypothetical protein
MRRYTPPLTQEIYGAPWSVSTTHGQVIKKFQQQILQHIQKSEAMNYWKKNEK